jgi:hypothetical protein
MPRSWYAESRSAGAMDSQGTWCFRETSLLHRAFQTPRRIDRPQ